MKQIKSNFVKQFTLSIAVSNPPPSPEAVEQSPDFKSLAINHVNNDEVDLSEKPSTSHGLHPKELQTYEDDVLDVHCGDMEFF